MKILYKDLAKNYAKNSLMDSVKNSVDFDIIKNLASILGLFWILLNLVENKSLMLTKPSVSKRQKAFPIVPPVGYSPRPSWQPIKTVDPVFMI